MADLLGRVGKMLAMWPMTVIPLRRGPPPFTIALGRMRYTLNARTWELLPLPQAAQKPHLYSYYNEPVSESTICNTLIKKGTAFRNIG